MGSKKEVLKEFIEIYEVNGRWYVDLIDQNYENDSYNIACSTEGKEQALKNALVNLCLDKLKAEESLFEIELLMQRHHTENCSYDSKRCESTEIIYGILHE